MKLTLLRLPVNNKMEDKDHVTFKKIINISQHPNKPCIFCFFHEVYPGTGFRYGLYTGNPRFSCSSKVCFYSCESILMYKIVHSLVSGHQLPTLKCRSTYKTTQ